MPDMVGDEAERLLRLIDSGEVLGATRQLALLGDCLVALAQSRASNLDLRIAATSLVQHIAKTRGESSQAVINGLRIMAAPTLDLADGNLAASLESAVDRFRESLQSWVLDLRAHATKVLTPFTNFLAYDYSSTVSSVLADLSRAADANLTVFVPEARSLGGGAKYLTDWQDLGITAHLIPDAALGWALEQCDVALAGAETLSLEGGCYNTIGTALTAREAQRSHVPFYVLSILLKADFQTPAGERPIPTLDFTSSTFLPTPITQGLKVLGTFPDLDYTPPTLITAAITEQGSLRPRDIAGAARSLVIEGVRHRG